jgi:hypothetical protein
VRLARLSVRPLDGGRDVERMLTWQETALQVIASISGISGTLVVAIPCREGLLVGADRRSTLRGEQVDGASKLEVLDGSPITAITVTGTGEFISDPPAGESAAFWLAKAPRHFDARAVVRTAINRRERTLEPATIHGVADDLVSALRAFFNRHPPELLSRYAGEELCRAVMFQCRGNPPARVVATFTVAISKSREIGAADLVVRNFASTEPFEVCRFGETQYVDEHVLSDFGRASLTPKLKDLLSASPPIAEFSAADAELVAHGLIIAASATSSSIPIPSGNGIGGGVTVLLIRSDTAEVRDAGPP